MWLLAEADHPDVLEDDELVVAADLAEGALQIGLRIAPIAGEQLLVGAHHAGRGVEQPLAVRVVAGPLDQGADRGLGVGLGGWVFPGISRLRVRCRLNG